MILYGTGGFLIIHPLHGLSDLVLKILSFWVQKLSTDIGKAPSTLKQLGEILDSCKHDLGSLEKMKWELSQLYKLWQTIFVWQDGPLVQAMKNGDLLLVDEISLADDSVLERLNSVLEPDRKLVSVINLFNLSFT